MINFNPRSREGSDVGCLTVCYFGRISIHAPAKGATDKRKEKYWCNWNFNPRSREGSDNGHMYGDIGFLEFQSTLPRRERLGTYDTEQIAKAFQSTLPRRDRRFSSK